ncbi:HalD/BesD family halogenase [Rhodococcus sp. BE178]|uniref:HalD/BesD family halogenase n=1 Tax=Rhodococcus sp. BE178 TaxID=2817737 RepID=UPI003D1F7B6D
MSQATAPSYADVVDLTRYPINDLDGDRGRAFIAACREELLRTGVCQLSGFMVQDAVDRMVEQAIALAPSAFRTDNTHTVYFESTDESVSPDHPRSAQQRSAKQTIACDQIPMDSPIRRLYESDDLVRFIAAVLRKDKLYRSADPLDAVMIAMFEDGDELGWHFDRSEFAVTVMYQDADEGGHFDYYPALRSAESENYGGVARVLEGNSDGIIRLTSSPGTLAIFHGRHALHRVSPTAGAKPRINSVITYGEDADMRLNELTQDLFYGRAE